MREADRVELEGLGERRLSRPRFLGVPYEGDLRRGGGGGDLAYDGERLRLLDS